MRAGCLYYKLQALRVRGLSWLSTERTICFAGNRAVYSAQFCTSSLSKSKLSNAQDQIKNRGGARPKQFTLFPQYVDTHQEYAIYDWEILYRFSYIKAMRLISRMKLYQTGLTILAVPSVLYFYSLGSVSALVMETTIGTAGFAGTMLYLMSGYFRRTIGLIALNEDENIVRVSHLTFWGKRRDLYIPAGDIIPLSDLSDNTQDIYVKFRCYDSSDFLYLYLQHGNMQREKLSRILGV